MKSKEIRGTLISLFKYAYRLINKYYCSINYICIHRFVSYKSLPSEKLWKEWQKNKTRFYFTASLRSDSIDRVKPIEIELSACQGCEHTVLVVSPPVSSSVMVFPRVRCLVN